MTSELIYETLNFMNIYLLKVYSVHLSSAKHMPYFLNIRVLSFWFRLLILESFPFVPPPQILHVHLGDANNMRPLSWADTSGKDPNFEKPY